MVSSMVLRKSVKTSLAGRVPSKGLGALVLATPLPGVQGVRIAKHVRAYSPWEIAFSRRSTLPVSSPE